MELLKDVIAIDLFLYLRRSKAFVISDMHIGYEESLNRKGILVPKSSISELTLRLEKALEKIRKTDEIRNIVINGDTLHEFGKGSKKDRSVVNKLLKFLSIYGKVILIIGNHDRYLKFVISDEFDMVETFRTEDILILHGDQLPSSSDLSGIKTLIIGHEHPAVSVASGARAEKFKCFLKGKYSRKDIIVMPSCNLFLEGTDILKERLLSPILKKCNLSGFEVFIVEDKIYDFGKVRNLQNSMN